MKRLIRAELHKLTQNRMVLLGLVVAFCANFFFSWTTLTRGGISMESYRIAGRVLQDLSLEEQTAWLAEHTQTQQTMQTVESVEYQLMQGSRPEDIFPEEWEIYQENREAYQTGEYLVFCNNTMQEWAFSAALQQEAETVQRYPDLMREIQQGAGQISSISIFQKDEYRSRETAASSAVFAGMENTKVQYYPAIGVMRAINQKATDFLIFGCMLVISLGLVRVDMDSGLLPFIQSHRRGRAATAWAKIIAFCLALLMPVLLLYSQNLLFSQFCYGLGLLNRSIQSLPAFSHCTLKITVGEYFFWFGAAKWAAACISGLFAMVICLLARQPWTGYLASALFWSGCGAIRNGVSANSHYNLWKYANPISLMETNELLGVWKSIYWFGRPIPRHWVEAVAAVLFLAVSCITFVTVFCHKNYLQKVTPRRILLRHHHSACYRKIWQQECYKSLFLQEAGLLLVAFMIVQGAAAAKKDVYFLPQELCYQQCMTQLAGPYDRQAYETYQKLAETAIAQRPTQEEIDPIFGAQRSLLEDVLIEEVVPQINAVVQSQKEGHPKYLLYEIGYERLFHHGTLEYRWTWAALTAGLITLCCVGIFGTERTAHMETLLGTTPNGRTQLAKIKLKMAVTVACIIGMSLYIPHLVSVLHLYGLPVCQAPAESLWAFQSSFVARWPLWLVITLDMAGVLTGCVIIACVVCWFSYRLENLVLAVVVSAAAFVLPPVLQLVGLRQLYPLSVGPLFALAEAIQAVGTSWAAGAMLLVWGAFAWLSVLDLTDHFGRVER